MITKFTKEEKIIKAWLDKVQNVKFHYYYKPKHKQQRHLGATLDNAKVKR